MESENEMRGMMEMWGMRMGMQGIGVRMRGIRVVTPGIGGRNEGNQSENLRTGVETCAFTKI